MWTTKKRGKPNSKRPSSPSLRRKCLNILNYSESNLSGALGKNLINMEFPLAAENPGSTHDLLMQLRETRLTDDILIDTFY